MQRLLWRAWALVCAWEARAPKGGFEGGVSEVEEAGAVGELLKIMKVV